VERLTSTAAKLLDWVVRNSGQHGRDHLAEHRAILEAALRRDADEVVVLMRKHLKRTVDLLLAAGFARDGDKRRKRTRKQQAR
jgi:GntR family transcriptional regulator, carbon starvation induced regulator